MDEGKYIMYLFIEFEKKIHIINLFYFFLAFGGFFIDFPQNRRKIKINSYFTVGNKLIFMVSLFIEFENLNWAVKRSKSESPNF
jgi:hypothetical protein